MARFDLSDEEWAVIASLLPFRGVAHGEVMTAKCLTGFSISCVPGHLGVTCPNAMAREPRFTTAMSDGAEGVCGRQCLTPWPKRSKTASSSSIAPSSRHTAQRLAQKGGTGDMYWTLTRRSHK